jgi:hypothetical protein
MLVKTLTPTVARAIKSTACLLTITFVGLVSLPRIASADTEVEKKLRDVAERLNQKAPYLIDADTRVDRVTVERGPTFNYHHTMLRAKSVDVDTAAFNGPFAAGLRAKVCSAPQMKPMLQSGVTLGYLYRAIDGTNVGSIRIAPKDCGL